MKRFYVAMVLLVFCFSAQSVLAAPYAYITQVEFGTVTVLDTVKNKKVATIDVGGMNGSPIAIAMSPDGRNAYVSSQSHVTGAGSWVTVIDVLTHTVTATIPVGAYPIGTAILPNGTKLYVAGYTGPVYGELPGITIIDTTSNTVETTIPFGNFPYAVAAHPDSSKVYVTDYDDGTVTVIDTASQTVTHTINVGYPVLNGIAVHPDGTRVYVTNEGGSNISIIDTSTNNITETISLTGFPIGGSPDQVAFNPTGSRAYVTTWGNGVYVIDATSRTVIATIDVGLTGGGGVDVSPDGSFVYVNTNGFDFKKDKPFNYGVKVIDAATNAVKKKIKLLGLPYSMGNFIGGPQSHMTVGTTGSGTGKVISKKITDIDCGSKCEADFYVDRKIQLRAVPDEGFVFTGWSGGACTKKSKACTLVIKDDYSVTATFEPK